MGFKVNDLPAPEVRPLKVDRATIGTIEAREVRNKKVMISVPLTYYDQDGEERVFTARLFIKEEWLTPEYAEKVKQSPGDIDEKELMSFNINVRGLLRGLFVSAGLVDADIDDFTSLEGKEVGFNARPQRNDHTRRQISSFYVVREIPY